MKTGEDRHSAQDVVSSTKEVTESRGAQRGEKGPFCLHTWGVPSSPLPAQTLLGFDSSLHLTPTHPSTVSYLLFSPQGTAGSQAPWSVFQGRWLQILGMQPQLGPGTPRFQLRSCKVFPSGPFGSHPPPCPGCTTAICCQQALWPHLSPEKGITGAGRIGTSTHTPCPYQALGWA